jgi:hypothetical protein
MQNTMEAAVMQCDTHFQLTACRSVDGGRLCDLEPKALYTV